MLISWFILVITAIAAIAIPETHVLHEKRDVHLGQWVKRGRVQEGAIFPMRVGLRQENLEKGEQWLMDVSHPRSKNYGKHWTSEKVIEMFAPSQETVTKVRKWLVESGIEDWRITHTENKGWLAFDATKEEAERLLHTKYHEYEHLASGHITSACDSYHVPKHIKEHVDYITPGIKLLAPSKSSRNKRSISSKSNRGSDGWDPTRHSKHRTYNPPSRWLNEHNPTSDCDKVITPACVRALYSIPLGTKAHPSNAMGIFEEGNAYSQDDLDLFFANFTVPRIPNGTHPKIDLIDGAVAPVSQEQAGSESNLDFMVAYPIIWPQGTVLYQTDDENYASGRTWFVGGFNTFLDAIDGSYCTYCAYGQCGNDENDPVYPDPAEGGYKGKLMCGIFKPTNVISISYGGQESDVPAYYQKRQCNEFLKLGLQGVSVFFASGDSGVGGPGGCLGQFQSVFSPTWPNNCPYVTNVGATKINPGQTVEDSESAVVDPRGHPWTRDFYSGGGFSNIHPLPSYQKAVVEKYFEHNKPPYETYTGDVDFDFTNGRYNVSGRGIPDVAANGDNIGIFLQGQFQLHGGTSASAPIFAAVINRINEERLDIGKRPVGFVNPVLYAYPEVLNDVTNGTNPGCGTQGFSAVRGWDPVTGLGSPNFPKMLKLFLSLP